MNHKGSVKVVITLMLALAVFLSMWFIWEKYSSAATKNIDEFRSCEGAMGSLSGFSGKCLPTDDCSGTPVEGHYLQRIGKGPAAGCPEAGSPYCCIVIPDSANPPASQDIASAYCSNLPEGTWGYAFIPPNGQKPICTTLPANGVIPIPNTNAKLLLFFKPKDNTDTRCQVRGNNKVATYVLEQNGRYTVNPTTVCWQAKDADKKIIFYLGNRNEITTYFAGASTVLLQLDLTLVSQSSTKNLQLKWQ